VREDPRAPSESNRDVTPPIDAIVLKALAKNPANRYQSAGEMRADLLRAAAGRPVMATPVMREAERTAMIAAPPANRGGPPTRPTARVAPPPRRGSTWVAVALTLLGVLAVAALGIGLYVANNHKTEVPVPELKGRSAVEANQLVVAAKLKPEPSNITSPDCAQNTVVTQNPTANAQVNEGTTVQYQICAGPGDTTVPQLIGLSRAAADQALKANHLTGTFVEVNSDATAGTVVDANPKPTTSVKQNSAVQVSISKGNMKKVPSVVGKTTAEARAALSQAGFKVKESTQEAGDPTQVGKVISQDPDGDKIVDPTKVTVTIFIGKAAAPPVPPPSTPTASATPTP
jgi:serine/threonine-protein kinase